MATFTIPRIVRGRLYFETADCRYRPMDRRTSAAAAYLARKTQMLSSAGNDCAQNRASLVCGGKRIASAVSSADPAGSQQTRRRRDRKCNLYHGRARGILDVDDYSLATRASS